MDKRSNTAQVHMYLLRPFRIEQKGSSVHLPTRKTESLLAYLVLNPGFHSREKLATLFWADSSESSARGSLRKALNFIRKQLGSEIMLADREQVQLNPDFDFYCDAAEFERQAVQYLSLENPNINEIEIDLYQDDLLPGSYEDWIFGEREQYYQLYVKVLLRAVEVLRAQSEYNTAVQYAQKLLIRDSTNERAYQHLIFCHIALGDRHGALQQYEACRKVLEKELGVTPAQETRALYGWITQSSDMRSLAARVTNLPIPISSFVGRGRELAEIKQLLSHARLVTLTGVGGSGKTRLAIRVATELIDSFHHGAWWVDLSSLADETLLPQSVARCLGVIESPEQTLIESIIAAIQKKEMLLVLDNCEHLVEACAPFVNSLLTRCPHLKILTTSREALRVDGEILFSVPTLQVPKANKISIAELLLEFESVKLFVARASTIQSNFVFDDSTSIFIAQICRHLDGIPLAIELAAARVRTMSAKQIAMHLQDMSLILVGGNRSALHRQQTLRAAIDWSYNLLTSSEQILFRRLSIFTGGWTLDAAEDVCSDATIESERVLELLEHLINKSMVLAEDAKHDTRYRILETLRQYANEKLIQNNELDTLLRRHASFFLKLADEARPELIGPTQRYWLEKLDQEKDNCRAALHWLLRNDMDAAARFADGLFWFWHTFCYWSEGREWYDQILNFEMNPDGNKSLTKARLAQMLREAGWLALDEIDTSQGQLLSEQSLSLYRELGDKNGIALALISLGWAAYYLSDFSRARTLAEESLGFLKEMGLTSKYESVLNLLGHITRVHGSYDQATQFYKEALKWSRETGNKQAIAYTLSVWGYSTLLQGDLNRARKLTEESLQFSQEVRLEWNIAEALATLGDIARIQGEYENASKLYDECDEIWERLGHPRESGYLLWSRGWLSRVQGDQEKAIGFFKQGLTLWREVGDKRWIAECLEGLAGMAVDAGKTQLAVKLLGAAERIREEMNFPLSPVYRPNYEQDVAIIRSALGESNFIKAWEDGRALTIERVIEYALEDG